MSTKPYITFCEPLSDDFGEVLSVDKNYTLEEFIEANDPDLEPKLAIVEESERSFFDIQEDLSNSHLNVPLVTFKPVYNIYDFVTAGGASVINPGVLQFPVANKIVRRVGAQEKQSLHIEEAFNGDFHEYKSVQLTNFLTLGAISDIIAQDAVIAGFDSARVRNTTLLVATYFSYLFKNGQGHFPIEIQYAFSDDEFLINFNVTVENFITEYLSTCFMPLNATSEALHSILDVILNITDLLDITLLKKTSKVILQALWTKDTEWKEDGYFSTLLLSSVDYFKRQNDIDMPDFIPENAIRDIDEKIAEDLERVHLEGAITSFKDRESYFAKHPLLFQNLKKFIQDERDAAEDKIPDEELRVEDIDGFLMKGPNKEFTQKLSDVDKMSLIDSIVKGGKVEDDDLTRIKNTTEHIIDEARVVPGNPEYEEVFKKVIKAVKSADRTDVATWVSGAWGEEESKVVVKNVNEVITDEVWRIKGNGVKEALYDEIVRIKGDNGNIDDVKKVIASTIQKTFDFSQEESDLSGENLVKNAIAGVAVHEVIEEKTNEKLGFENDIRLSNLLEELTYKNKSIDKMRRDISHLKVENEALKSFKATVESATDSLEKPEEIRNIVSRIESLEVESKSKDKVIEFLKADKQRLLDGKTQEIDVLKNKIGDEASKRIAQHREMISVSATLTTLTRNLERANRQIKDLQEKGKGTSAQIATKDAHQIEVLREKLEHYRKTCFEVAEQNKALLQQLSKAKHAMGGENNKNDIKVQYMQQIIDKQKALTDKVSSDLVEKKREMQKYKAENVMLTNKIAELERKLAKK